MSASSCASPAVVWDALRAAAEADLATARLIVSSAGIVVSSPDLTLCYDVKGATRLSCAKMRG